MATDRKEMLPLATRLSDKIVQKVIDDLMRIKDTLFGDDSVLENAWEEICVQRQGEESYYWSVYERQIEHTIAFHLKELSGEEQTAMWYDTDAWCDWDEECEPVPPVDLDDIVEEQFGKVLDRAESFTNDNIEKFLWGENDEFEENDEEADET